MGINNSRQSFLGNNLNDVLDNCLVGIVGLGGGGSQIVQQLAHIGFKNYLLCDFDTIEDTNLNRNVGATKQDVARNATKMSIAKRQVRKLHPDASIIELKKKWQDNDQRLKPCDIIFGCLDGYQNRAELESFTRRSLIPYIDIGMDVIRNEIDPPRMSGQVFASIPGYPCMRCYDFINERVLGQEVKKYGDAGIRPQVIWPNAILAGTAVGLAINLLTNWIEKGEEQIIYYEYDGNLGTIRPHVKCELRWMSCDHYRVENAGDVQF